MFRFSLLLLFLFIVSPHAGAQETKTIKIDELRKDYQDTVYPKLLDLYWKNSRLSTQNVEHIDFYLKVKECDIVKQYYDDDFEWKKIREAMADHIKAYRKSLPDKFKFVQPLELGEYNFERVGFVIKPDYIYTNIKRMRVSGNSAKDFEECLKLYPVKDYYEMVKVAPYNATVSLSQPFNFEFLPVEEDVAKLYLDYLKEISVAPGSRPAYIVFYMTLQNYLRNDVNYNVDGSQTAEFKANIDFIEVYADRSLEYPLYTHVIEN